MNKLILILVATAATSALLVGTFVTAAAMRGANLSQLPVVGTFFPMPEEASIDEKAEITSATVESEIQDDRRTPEQVIDMSASPLQAFLLPTPFNAADLEALEQALQTRLAGVAEREKALDQEERKLEESKRHLADLQAEMETVRTGLIEERDDTVAMQEEAEREEQAAKERRLDGLKKMSNLFADGDPEDSARMLVETYSPEEAGIVLSGLPADRVRDLMQGIRIADAAILSQVEASYRMHVSEE